MFALCKTRLCARGSNCFVGHLCVTFCGNSFLLNNNFVADGAMFALCKTRFCASGINRRVNYFRMTICGYFGLFNFVIAAAAVLAVGKSRRGTCCGFALDFHDVMTE